VPTAPRKFNESGTAAGATRIGFWQGRRKRSDECSSKVSSELQKDSFNIGVLLSRESR
jgi:hypothetical protein